MPTTRTDHMGLKELQDDVSELWNKAVGDKTMIVYNTGVKSFTKFLLLNNIINSVQTLPEVSEDIFLLYIAYCYKTLHIKHSTIRLYLSGIRFEYLKRGINCPLIRNDFANSRITTQLNAVKRSQETCTRPRHPITASVLSQMCLLLKNGYISPFVDILLKAVFVTSFFGFLRCGEIAISQPEFDPSKHICLNDVTFCETHVQLLLRSSKTDPYKKGIVIPLFKSESNTDLCPYRALTQYVELRKINFQNNLLSNSPFFLTENGKALSRSYFMMHIKHILARLGYDNSHYSGHSLRVGAATSASAARLEDHLIQTLGRWSSDCYKTYIRTPTQVIKDAQFALLQEL